MATDAGDLERRLKRGSCSRFSMVPKCKEAISLENEVLAGRAAEGSLVSWGDFHSMSSFNGGFHDI